MNNRAKKGFTLILVLVTMAVVAAGILVLTAGSNAVLFQSNRAYLQAVEQNLTASALAWAKENAPDNLDKTVVLDIMGMNLRRSSLSVTMGQFTNEEPQVQIDTLCSRGRQTQKRSDKYRIKL